MKILLLGASGFIGREILSTLSKEKNCLIMALENKRPVDVKGASNVSIIRQSLNTLNLNKLPHQPDIIIHAARYRTGKLGKFGRHWMAAKGKRANRSLMKQLNRMKNKPKLIYISGSLMYGSVPGYLINEKFPLSPTSFAREYVAAEEVFLREIDSSNPNVLMLRVPWVIGAGSWFDWNYMQFIQRENKIQLYGKGKNMMTFIDLRDLAQIVVKILRINQSGILNLFNPEYMSQFDFATKMSRLFQKEIKAIELEQAHISSAIKEAFQSDIQLGSNYHELQLHLQENLKPIDESLLFYGKHYIKQLEESTI
ncbi:MAG: NAD-dependent epimerase/dehydratase family protein [Vicingaceae bacterium]